MPSSITKKFLGDCATVLSMVREDAEALKLPKTAKAISDAIAVLEREVAAVKAKTKKKGK